MELVRITGPGAGLSTGVGTRIETESGIELSVTRAVITIAPDEIIKADLTLFCGFCTVNAKPVFHIKDPLTGELKQVSSIAFVDGSVFNS